MVSGVQETGPFTATVQESVDTKKWLAEEEHRFAEIKARIAFVESTSFDEDFHVAADLRTGKPGRTVRRGDPDWEKLRYSLARSLDSASWAIGQWVRMHRDMVASWKGPVPILSFEERFKEVEAKKASNKVARSTAKADKLQKKIAFYQKAIDSLLKRAADAIRKADKAAKSGHLPPKTEWGHPPPYDEVSKLLSIANDVWSRTFYDFGYQHETSIDLLDRMPVWQALGLYDDKGRAVTRIVEGYRAGSTRRVLGAEEYSRPTSDQMEGLRALIGMPSRPAGMARGTLRQAGGRLRLPVRRR